MNTATPRFPISAAASLSVVRAFHHASKSGCAVAVVYSASAPGESLRASRPGPGRMPPGNQSSP